MFTKGFLKRWYFSIGSLYYSIYYVFCGTSSALAFSLSLFLIFILLLPYSSHLPFCMGVCVINLFCFSSRLWLLLFAVVVLNCSAYCCGKAFFLLFFTPLLLRVFIFLDFFFKKFLLYLLLHTILLFFQTFILKKKTGSRQSNFVFQLINICTYCKWLHKILENLFKFWLNNNKKI